MAATSVELVDVSAPSFALDADRKLREIVAELPELPSAVRYYDDFLLTHRAIDDFDKFTTLILRYDGRDRTADFSDHDTHVLGLLRHIVFDLLARLDVSSVARVLTSIAFLPEKLQEVIRAAVLLAPQSYRQFWVTRIFGTLRHHDISALKQVLFSMCNQHIAPWGPHLHRIIADLPGPKCDRYKTVKTGECFVPLDQQSLIVDYIDEMVSLVAVSPADVETEDLCDVCMLVLAYQMGARQGQLARIQVEDVRIHPTSAVHVRLLLTKKRRSKKKYVTRSVKREWCPLFVAYKLHRIATHSIQGNVPSTSFFGHTPDQCGKRVQHLCAKITGETWSSGDLRHTAAQRQVDAGCSYVSLIEFLGHDTTGSALVYFDTSPAQAQKVNQALGLSPIYSAVAEVARTRTIDKQVLLGLSPDQQIGGMPHGIPIAGIGACTVGQPNCFKNPVLSCYTCRKFLPVRDASIHRQVTADLRMIAKEFYEASRGNEQSPAYTQLRRTIVAAEAVASDVEGKGAASDESFFAGVHSHR